MPVQLVHTNAELDQLVADAKAEGKRVAFVPTMGALHEGHLRLVDIAREHAEFVVVSIFVNPLQFGEGEDFDRYPRTLEADVEALEGHPCDVVFAPWVEEVYPPEGKPGKPTERAGIIGSTFEGAARPGHFDGMLTVVGRLFDLVKPDVAVFGQKDAQQLLMVRKLAGAKFEGLEIIAAPTVREPSGLAMSSRNRYLTPAQRESATVISKALRAVGFAANHGLPASYCIEAGLTLFAGEPETKLEYLAIVDSQLFKPVNDKFKGEALAIVAAQVGGVRLIDNQIIEIREQDA
jgi:pantoate--beta-alanine ligase